MPKRYFNWKLAIVLLIALTVLGVTAFGLRRWQKRGRAEEGLTLGNKAYSEHRWEDAARELGRYLGVRGDDVPTLLKYADAQLKIRPPKRNNIQQAIGTYQTVLRVDKNNSEAAKQLTELYLALGMSGAMGMFGEAERIATKYLETKQDPDVRRMLAAALAGQRKFDEAAAELKSIIAEHPEQILAYEALGQLTEQRRESSPEPPEHWFNEAVKNNPSSALAYISRAGFYTFYTRSRDRAKALADLEQAEKLDLSDPAVRLRLAGGFIDVNALDKAEEQLVAVQKTTPSEQTLQTLWRMWAQLAIQSRSPEKMLTVAETGLKELSSQPWEFMPTAAELFIRCGQLDRAADCISQLRQKDIAPGVVAFLEGLVADLKSQPFEAVKCWQRAIQLDNKSPRVRLALAAALSRLGDTQSALRQLRTRVSENPNFSEAHLTLARLLAQTGNWAETVEQTRIAMQLSPDDPNEPALLHLQARMQLLATSSTPANDQSWQDIKNKLASLEETTKGALEVKLAQFQLAIHQDNFADAEALVTQLKKDHPSQIRVAMAEADLLIVQEKTDEAISKLNEIVKQFPDSIEPVRALAFLLNQQKNREKCEATIKDALARIQQLTIHRELNLLLAELYTQWGQSEKVYPLLNELAQKLPNDISIKRRLLGCQQVIKDPEKAQRLVDDIKSLEGEDGWQWRYEQARVWFVTANFKDRHPQITSLLQENLLANPDDQASRLLLAATHERAGDLQMALSTYRQALDRSPQDLRIIIPTVAALYKAKEYDQAEQILNRASQEKLRHPQLQQLQFESYLRRGQLSSASDILENILGTDPNNQAVCLSLALLKMRQNKFNEASQLLDKLRAGDPNSLPVMVAQIQLNLQQQKPDEALGLCNKIVNNLHNASAYILRARTFASLKQTDKAIEDLNLATTTEPNNVEAWVARSDFYYTTGQRDKAEADIQQALSLAPNNTQIQKRAVSLLLISGIPDKIRQARDILDKGLETNPDNGELQMLKARLLLAEGTAPAIENATQILQTITKTQPRISEAWLLLGEISLRQGEPGKAIDIALRGLVHKANDKALLTLKARAEAAWSPVQAIPTLRVLRDADPNDTETAILLANAYILTNEPQKAVELLNNQLSVCKNDSIRRRCRITLAVALYKNGNKAEAQKEFDALLQSEPNDASPLLAQARLFKDDQLWNQLNQSVLDWYQKHPKDTQTPVTIAGELTTVGISEAKKTAEEILRMILNKDSDCVEAMRVLATLLQITERFEESATAYQKILALQPDNVVAINNLAWIMCEEQGKFQQALDLTERGLKIAPNYIDLIDTRGVAYYRLGDFNKAIQDFTTCIKLYPKETLSGTASRFHLARAFAALGEKDKAIEYLNQALNSESQTKGLSPKDLAEARRLLEELLKGGKEGG